LYLLLLLLLHGGPRVPVRPKGKGRSLTETTDQ
jgi:hypothetical protein